MNLDTVDEKKIEQYETKINENKIYHVKLLNCELIKKKMSECLKKNEGNITECKEFKTEYEKCLKFIDK